MRERTFRHALEVGCGPFTNLRLIGALTSIERVSLLDPLAGDYQNHPGCRYTKQFLSTDLGWPSARSAAVLRRLYGLSPRLVGLVRPLLLKLSSGARIPVEQLHIGAAENVPLLPHHDLVVAINVMEHCFDAERVLGALLNGLDDGGMLVFHDHLYREERPLGWYDPYHPLRVDASLILSFLHEHFEPLLETYVPPDEAWGEHWEQLYFIGRKLPNG